MPIRVVAILSQLEIIQNGGARETMGGLVVVVGSVGWGSLRTANDMANFVLCRLKVTALVKNSAATQQAFGQYVDPVQGAVGAQSDSVNN
jgi:hypothetical protein